MGVSLEKGGSVSLYKAGDGLESVLVNLGWAKRTMVGADFDLDASALMCGPTGKVIADPYFVFYNNVVSPDRSVEHKGDDPDGSTGEQIAVDLTRTPSACSSIVFLVSIHKAIQRRQSFGQVRDAYISVVDAHDNVEIARYDLSEDASTEAVMIFGELYRETDEWHFRAVGKGYPDGLAALLRDYGVDVS